MEAFTFYTGHRNHSSLATQQIPLSAKVLCYCVMVGILLKSQHVVDKELFDDIGKGNVVYDTVFGGIFCGRQPV